MRKLITIGVLTMTIMFVALVSSRAGRRQGSDKTKINQYLIAAVRNNDSAGARALLDQGADPNAKDSSGMSGFLYAAGGQDADLVRAMLAKGANINSPNSRGATALIISLKSNVDDAVIQLLLDSGAAVAPHNKAGETALTIAVSNKNHFAVSTLLRKGVDVNTKGVYDDTALLIASRLDDDEAVSLLADGGANLNALTNAGETALIEASRRGDEKLGELLIEKKADVGLLNREGRSALMFAAQSGSAELVTKLIAAGAKVNLRDNADRTALMAVRGLSGAEIARSLIAKGADVNASDQYGCTALMRAAMGADAGLVRVLLSSGANPALKDIHGRTAAIRAHAVGSKDVIQALASRGNTGSISARVRNDYLRDVVQDGLPLLQATALGFQKQVGVECYSCHHQSMPAFAVGTAKSRGFHVDDRLAGDQSAFVLSFFSKARDTAVKSQTDVGAIAQVSGMFPGQASQIGYGMLGLESGSIKPDSSTAAVALYLTRVQEKDGHWPTACSVRDPAEVSDFTETALAVHSIRIFALPDAATDAAAALERAKAWFIKAPPKNTEDRTFQLMGLVWAGVSKQDEFVQRAVANLIADQRSDGGWGNTPSIKSDAYATGEVLVALHLAGGLPVQSAAYQRGVDFLLRSREEDGTWFVRSRTVPFQPYFETGFPYGKDQFISCTTTCWATAALTLATSLPRRIARRYRLQEPAATRRCTISIMKPVGFQATAVAIPYLPHNYWLR